MGALAKKQANEATLRKVADETATAAAARAESLQAALDALPPPAPPLGEFCRPGCRPRWDARNDAPKLAALAAVLTLSGCVSLGTPSPCGNQRMPDDPADLLPLPRARCNADRADRGIAALVPRNPGCLR